ncbi:unnamed protein product [Cochlearia groenlandica]
MDVYGNIIGSTTEKQMVEEITPYARMIPSMIRVIAPVAAKKNITLKKYTVYRKKSVPQNIQEGDCGVYSLKYVECLDLGIRFAGLSDENMSFIRKKMDVEIYEEVPDDHNEMSNPVPHPKNKDKLLLLTNSLN